MQPSQQWLELRTLWDSDSDSSTSVVHCHFALLAILNFYSPASFVAVVSDQNLMREVTRTFRETCDQKWVGEHVKQNLRVCMWLISFVIWILWVNMWLDFFSDTSFISSISFFAWHSSSSSLPWASLLIRFIRLKFCNCDVSPSQSWAWQTSPPSCDIGFVTSSSQRPPHPLASSNCSAPELKLWLSSSE